MKLIIASVLASALLVTGLSGCTRDDKKPESGAPAGSAATESGAKIAFDKPVYDFGKVTEGDKVKHVFVVSNTGSAPLHLTSVTASCGCTAVVLKDKMVAPGKSTEIQAVFDTKGRSGPNTKSVTVHSNDPNRPVSRLVLKGIIERLVSFLPAVLRVSTQHGKNGEMTAWLRGKLAPKAKLSVVDVSVPDGDKVKAEVVTKKTGDKLAQGIKFTVVGGKVDRFNGQIKVSTGLDKPATLSVPFHATVVGNVRLQSKALFFDPSTPAGKQRRLKVSSKLASFKVKEAKILEGPYEAFVEKPDAGDGYVVRVRLKLDKGTAKQLQGKLRLVTNDSLEPTIDVPLTRRSLSPLGLGHRLHAIPRMMMGRRPSGRSAKPVLPATSK